MHELVVAHQEKGRETNINEGVGGVWASVHWRHQLCTGTFVLCWAAVSFQQIQEAALVHACMNWLHVCNLAKQTGCVD
jgi:hypothetical protein